MLGRYEVYVPQTLNDGTPVDALTVLEIEIAMRDLFGGYTHNPTPQKGVWVEPRTGDVYTDTIHVYTVFAEEQRAVETLASFVGVKTGQLAVAVILPHGEALLVEPAAVARP